jgi:hypothetical protein
LPEPLAEAGAGSSILKCVSDIGSDLPLPRWGVLSGKSRCTSRRWRLLFVQFQPRDFGKKYLVGREMCTVQLMSVMQQTRCWGLLWVKAVLYRRLNPSVFSERLAF